MSQYDWGTIDPYVWDGVQLSDALNQWKAAIHTMHRGAARPSYAVPGMMWINDSAGATAWVVNVYLGSPGDKPLFTYNTTTGEVIISAATGGTFSAATLLAIAPTFPAVRWESTGNPIDLKKWRVAVDNSGQLRFSSFSDADVETGTNFTIARDGSIPSLIPPGVIWDYGGATAPTGWYFCDGAVKSTTTDSALFTAIGYAFGGSGSSFNVPDLRGRVAAGKDNMGGTAANRLTVAGAGINGVALNGSGGAQTISLDSNQTASHDHSISDPTHYHGSDIGGGTTFLTANSGQGAWAVVGGAGGPNQVYYSNQTNFAWTGIAGTTGLSGSGAPHINAQPTLIVNKIIRR